MLKPNVMQMLMIAKDIGIDHLEDAYNHFQRYYDLFFSIENFAEQNREFTQNLIDGGLVDTVDGKLYMKDVSVDEAIKIYQGVK